MSDAVPLVPSVPLSLKARENASRSLKRIFDQINESLPGQQPSALNSLPSVDGSDGVNKLSEKDLPNCSTHHTHELRGSRQQVGTRDLLSLHNSCSESYVEEEAASEGNTRTAQQRQADTRLSSMLFSKEEAKETKSYGPLGRASFPTENGRSSVQQPSAGRLSLSKHDHEAPTNQLKELGGTTFPTTALTQEEGNGKAFGSPAQGDHSSYAEIAGQASLRPSSCNAGRKQATGQMTIFYSGIVNVYDDVPADKANAIMLLAGSGNPQTSFFLSGSPSTALPSPGTAASPVATNVAKKVAPVTSGVPFTASNANSPSTPSPTFPASVKSSVQRSHAELPFARKVSLARFLERRKDRVQSKASQNIGDSGPDPTAKRVCSRSSSPSPAVNSR